MAWWSVDPVRSGPTALVPAAWIWGIHVYMLHPRLVRPFPCIGKICEMNGHPYMATDTGTLSHNLDFHVDGLVVVQILSDLGPYLGRSVAWMEGIPVYGLYPRLVRHFTSIRKKC